MLKQKNPHTSTKLVNFESRFTTNLWTWEKLKKKNQMRSIEGERGNWILPRIRLCVSQTPQEEHSNLQDGSCLVSSAIIWIGSARIKTRSLLSFRYQIRRILREFVPLLFMKSRDKNTHPMFCFLPSKDLRLPFCVCRMKELAYEPTSPLPPEIMDLRFSIPSLL